MKLARAPRNPPAPMTKCCAPPVAEAVALAFVVLALREVVPTAVVELTIPFTIAVALIPDSEGVVVVDTEPVAEAEEEEERVVAEA